MRVHRSLRHVERNRAQSAARHRQSGKSPRSRHRRDSASRSQRKPLLHCTELMATTLVCGRDCGFDVFDQHLPVAIGHGVDRDADLVALLHPGHRDFQELQIADHDAIAAFERDGSSPPGSGRAWCSRPARCQSSLALISLRNLRTRRAAHRVHIKMMLSGRAGRAVGCHVEEGAQLRRPRVAERG